MALNVLRNSKNAIPLHHFTKFLWKICRDSSQCSLDTSELAFDKFISIVLEFGGNLLRQFNFYIINDESVVQAITVLERIILGFKRIRWWHKNKITNLKSLLLKIDDGSKLVMELINNICRYKRKVILSKEGDPMKQINVGRYPHGHALQKRLDFLFLLLKKSGLWEIISQ